VARVLDLALLFTMAALVSGGGGDVEDLGPGEYRPPKLPPDPPRPCPLSDCPSVRATGQHTWRRWGTRHCVACGMVRRGRH
jgi:hypothetical protein